MKVPLLWAHPPWRFSQGAEAWLNGVELQKVIAASVHDGSVTYLAVDSDGNPRIDHGKLEVLRETHYGTVHIWIDHRRLIENILRWLRRTLSAWFSRKGWQLQ